MGAVTIATNMAGRGTDIVLGGDPEAMVEQEFGAPSLPEGVSELEAEKHWPEEYREAFDRFQEQCAAERQEVLDAGGLFILGTERHESRRIDNQLRGRAGRQGDPGASRFFLSLEDDLLRLFGADRIGRVMDTLKMEEGVPIEAPMVTRSIENAQKKVEGRNFEIRKNLLEYDDVMDMQRKTIYGLRRNVLRGQDPDGNTLSHMALDLFEDVALSIIDTHAPRALRPEDWDLEGLAFALRQSFGVEFDFSEVHGRDGIEMYVWDEISQNFRKKREAFDDLETSQKAEEEARAEELGITFSIDDDEEVELSLFETQIRNQYLRSIDRQWRAHLQAMEQMRDSIGLQGYAQKDPKKEYKRRGFELFREMMLEIKTDIVEFISRSEGDSIDKLLPAPSTGPSDIALNRQPDAEDAPNGEKPQKPAVELPKVGRNDPCPCGSGKKYKKCHMRKKRKGNPRRKRVSAS